MRRSLLCSILASIALGSQVGEQIPINAPKESKRPNIVFIITDDQDLHLNSVDYTPLTRKYIAEEGTTFNSHHATIAICCPSRVSLWTGKAAHNTNVTDVFPPYGMLNFTSLGHMLIYEGGYPKFISQGLNDNFLPVWLQEAGYGTYYVGKLLNAHTVENYDKPFVRGFTGSVRTILQA